MLSHKYFLDSEVNFVLYGAGEIGQLCAQCLLKQGFIIKNFIDLRADELGEIYLEGQSIAVTTYEEYRTSKAKNTDVLLLCLRKSSAHDSLATILVADGFYKIIFLPNNYEAFGLSMQDAVEMKDFYSSLLKNEEVELRRFSSLGVPKDMSNFYPDCCFISSNNYEVHSWIPLELIFTNLLPPAPLRDFQDTHISMLAPLIDAIELFDSGRGNGEAWCFFHIGADTNAEKKQNLLTSLNLTYQNYAEELNRGMDFFLNNPIQVQWNKNGYFNIKGEMLPAVLFLVRNLKRIPATMSRQDYEQWLNKPSLKPVLEALAYTRTSSTYAPIEHPQMYNFPASRERQGDSRLFRVLRFLGSQYGRSLSGLTVLDVGAFHGYFSRQMARIGAKVTGVEINPEECEFARKLNSLLHLSQVNMENTSIQEYSGEVLFDITLLLTVLYWSFGTPECMKILAKVDALTQKFLIWESGAQIEEEKLFILENSSFQSYTPLCRTYGTGKIRELGVFIKT